MQKKSYQDGINVEEQRQNTHKKWKEEKENRKIALQYATIFFISKASSHADNLPF